MPQRGLQLSAGVAGGSDRQPAMRRHLCLLPLPTLLENIAGIYAPLLAGATCVIPPLADVGMSYGGLQAGRLTAAISARSPEPDPRPGTPAGAGAGGRPRLAATRQPAASSRSAAPRWRPRCSRRPSALGLPVYEGYGLSECGSVVCLNTPGNKRRGSVGRPLPHVTVRIDDRRQLIVREAGMLGYLGETSGSPPALKSRRGISAASMRTASCTSRAGSRTC